MKKDTSWGREAVVGEYQKELILPNLLRLLEIKRGDLILDLGCGPGFFAREFAKKGGKVVGIDISKELIELAKREPAKGIEYHIASADDLKFLPEKSVDKITIILAIQNIENVAGVFKECARVLKPSGKIFLVMNHPAFRVPKASDWDFDTKENIQYRRIDSYMTESKAKIEMHPSMRFRASPHTITFHRPLQYYFKILGNAGFAVSRLEEWISSKRSEPGQRAAAENRARKEFPLFLFMEIIKKS